MSFQVAVGSSYPSGSQMNVTIVIGVTGDFQARRDYNAVVRAVRTAVQPNLSEWTRNYDTLSVSLSIQADREGSGSEGQLLWNAVGKACDVIPSSRVFWNDEPLW